MSQTTLAMLNAFYVQIMQQKYSYLWALLFHYILFRLQAQLKLTISFAMVLYFSM